LVVVAGFVLIAISRTMRGRFPLSYSGGGEGWGEEVVVGFHGYSSISVLLQPITARTSSAMASSPWPSPPKEEREPRCGR